MAYKVFVDANVYLDFLMQRGNEWASAEAIFEMAEKNIIEVFTSASNLLNIMYAMGTYKIAKQQIISHITIILSYSKLTGPENKVFRHALASGFNDLEDAVQYYTALDIKCIDYFITSNTKDYKKAFVQLPVFTPKQFMVLYNKK